MSTSRRASKGVILSVTDDNSNIGANANSPLLGRTIELTEKEDSTERMCQITFQENGVITWARKYDSTSPKDLTGSWTDRSSSNTEMKVAILLNRHYSDDKVSTLGKEGKEGREGKDGNTINYKMERFYEATYHLSTEDLSSIRGEGKIEQERYSDLIPCGYFSFVTVDDPPDEVTGGKTTGEVTHNNDRMIEGIDY